MRFFNRLCNDCCRCSVCAIDSSNRVCQLVENAVLVVFRFMALRIFLTTDSHTMRKIHPFHDITMYGKWLNEMRAIKNYDRAVFSPVCRHTFMWTKYPVWEIRWEVKGDTCIWNPCGFWVSVKLNKWGDQSWRWWWRSFTRLAGWWIGGHIPEDVPAPKALRL